MWHFKRTRDGGYLTGIPARDLTDAEVDKLPKADRATFDANVNGPRPIYEHRDDAPAEAADKGADKPAGKGK